MLERHLEENSIPPTTYPSLFFPLQALNTPDIQDPVPYVPGTVRGKKWIPPPRPEPASSSKDDEKVELDLDLGDGDDVEVALNAASTDEIVDLAGILGLHSMMNQVYLY